MLLQTSDVRIYYLWGFPCLQWLGSHASTTGGMGSIPSQGTKIS